MAQLGCPPPANMAETPEYIHLAELPAAPGLSACKHSVHNSAVQLCKTVKPVYHVLAGLKASGYRREQAESGSLTAGL